MWLRESAFSLTRPSSLKHLQDSRVCELCQHKRFLIPVEARGQHYILESRAMEVSFLRRLVAQGVGDSPMCIFLSDVPSVLFLTRDEEFSVSSVLASDVIHASRRDIPCIFRVCVFVS